MKDNELIKLVDDLTLAALRHESAKQNLDKAAEELDNLSKKFNDEIDNIGKELSDNVELVYKVELVSKVFEYLDMGEYYNRIYFV